MTEPQKFFEELKAKYGEEHKTEIMDSIVSTTVQLIDFLAETAGVSFEVMCYSLVFARKQVEEETNATE